MQKPVHLSRREIAVLKALHRIHGRPGAMIQAEADVWFVYPILRRLASLGFVDREDNGLKIPERGNRTCPVYYLTEDGEIALMSNIGEVEELRSKVAWQHNLIEAIYAGEFDCPHCGCMTANGICTGCRHGTSLVMRQRGDIKTLRNLLSDIEWSGAAGACPACGGNKPNHTTDCAIAFWTFKHGDGLQIVPVNKLNKE